MSDAGMRLGVKGASAYTIRRWRLLLLSCLGLALMAVFAWVKLPRQENPTVSTKDATIVIPYPGAVSSDVEKQVLDIVEPALYAMGEVDWIESYANTSHAMLHIHFVDETNMDSVLEKVRSVINASRRDMPSSVQEPLMRAWSIKNLVQMVVTVVGNRRDAELTRWAKDLRKVLEGVPGVGKVDLKGDRERAIVIRLDSTKLAQHQLTSEDVAQRIKAANFAAAGGEVRIGRQVTLLQVDNEVTSVDKLRSVPVGLGPRPDGTARVTLLGDVAEVREVTKKGSARFLVDGQPAVALEVHIDTTDNAIEVGRRVRATLKNREGTLPEGVRFDITHDQPHFVELSIAEFIESLLEGVVLVMVVITLGMGWRPGLVVAGVVPLAVGGALLGLYIFGFALDQISIAGLIVALGLLVDDAVVVTESIQLMRDRGLSAVRSAVLGTARVFTANNGTTAVACASFFPLFFSGGDTGQYIRGLPATVCLSLGTSLLVAQLATPWFASLLLKPKAGVEPIPDSEPFDIHNDGAEGTHDERNPVIRWMKAAYAYAVPGILRHPGKVVVVATMLFVGSVVTIPKIGIQFFPKSAKPIVMVAMELPMGTDERVTTEKAAELAQVLRSDKEVRKVSASVEAAYPFVNMSRVIMGNIQGIADMLVEFQPGTDVSAAAQRIRSLASAVAGVRVTVDEIYEGPTVEHPIHINFVGDDYEHLAKYAEQAKAILREQPGALNVTDTLEKTVPVTQVRVDGEKAFARGVTPAAVGMALRTVYGGDKVTEIREGDDTLEVTFDASGTSVDAIEQTPVRGAVGGIHPIDAASNVQVKRAHAQLRHRDQRRVVTVFADVAGNALASKILEGAMPRLKAIALDPQSTMTFAGEAAETEKSFRGLGISALLAILIMLLVLVMMFDSLTLAAVIFAAVPYGLIGAVLGLVVTGYPFGFFSFLGLIALLGVYVNHKIYLVDRVRDLMGRGVSLEKAILDAGIDRLRPVVLTALTAVLGLVPLTLSGSPLFTPFGWVNIFGLVTSIPLSMILVPAFVALAFRYGRKNLIPVTVMPEPSRTSHPSNPSSPSDGSDRRHGRSSFRREGRGSAHVRVASSREFLGNVSLDRTLLGPTLLAPAAAPSVPAAKDSHPSAPSSRGQGTSFLRPSPRFFRPN